MIVGRGSCKDDTIIIPREIDGYRVTRIGAGAFADCHDLKSIAIPDGVERIGEKAFSGCGQLKEIRFGGTMEGWRRISLGSFWNHAVGTYLIACADGDAPEYRFYR